MRSARTARLHRRQPPGSAPFAVASGPTRGLESRESTGSPHIVPRVHRRGPARRCLGSELLRSGDFAVFVVSFVRLGIDVINWNSYPVVNPYFLFSSATNHISPL